MSRQNHNLESLDKTDLDSIQKVESNSRRKLLIKWIAGISLSLEVILLLACIVLLLQNYLTDNLFYKEIKID